MGIVFHSLKAIRNYYGEHLLIFRISFTEETEPQDEAVWLPTWHKHDDDSPPQSGGASSGSTFKNPMVCEYITSV